VRIRTVEISVGVFMLAGILALLVLALQVSGLSFDNNRKSYSLYAKFDNIGSLATRSKVTIAGVTVGRVTEISLDNDEHMGLIKMEIDTDVSNLTTDTAASILTNGLLGEKYIGLSTGADEEYLVDGDVIEDTQSALVLEELIGQFLFSEVNAEE